MSEFIRIIYVYMQIEPLTDHLIVKPLKEDESKAGIVLPESGKERPERGEVVAVGPGRILDDGKRLPMSVKVGDKVMFKQYAPDEIKVNDEKYLMMTESDILAIIK